MPPRRACDVCSKRKIRCILPSSGPPCDWCRNQGIECTSHREAQSSLRLTPAAVKNLLGRLDQLEGEVASKNARETSQSSISTSGWTPRTDEHLEAAQPKIYESPYSNSETSHSIQTPSSHSTQAPSSPPRNNVERWLGHSWYFRGIPILSPDGEKWLSTKVGQNFTFRALSSRRSCFEGAISSERDLTKLPEESQTHELAQAYFQSSTYHTTPILDPVLFNETIQLAYKPGGNAASVRSAVACIWALHALRGRFGARESRHATSSSFPRNGLGYLSLFTDDFTIDDIQALLLLYVLDSSIPTNRSRQRLLAIACQMIVDLSGHWNRPYIEYAPNISSERLHRHIRGLFWICYRLDKDTALRNGRPPILTQQYCDLKMPNEHDTWPVLENGVPSMAEPCLAAAARLSIIKENVCCLLFPPLGARTDDNQILLNIRHLDAELENWRVGLPRALQPTLTISVDSLTPTADLDVPGQNWVHILQLEYSYTLITIHTAIRKCSSGVSETGNIPEDLHQVVHSSINLSLEAARSTLHLLKMTAGMIGEDAFHLVMEYVPQAVMALFMNVVIHPRDPMALPDLSILTMFTGVIQGIDLSGVADDSVEEIQSLCEFMMELVRLGNSAIWKAKREGRK